MIGVMTAHSSNADSAVSANFANHASDGYDSSVVSQNWKYMKAASGPASTYIRAAIRPYRYGSALEVNRFSSAVGAKCWMITGAV